MNKENQAIENNLSTIASKDGAEGVGASTEIDSEAEVSRLEAERNKLIEESANYRLAYLKEKNKNKGGSVIDDEDDEDKMRRIAEETLKNSRLAEIEREKDQIIKKSLKENKELKQALMNKQSGIPTYLGTHTESKPVSDTLVTPEQMTAFKSRGWSDKDIERYKKNLLKNTR